MIFDARWCQLAWGLAAVLATAGCTPGPPYEAVVVYGAVSVNGDPVSNGEIRFYPSEGTSGPVTGAPIRQGTYEVIAKGGVPVGNHVVKIQAFREVAGDVSGIPAELAEDYSGDVQQFLPPRFNSRSELRHVVVPGVSRQQLDFPLELQPGER